MANEILTGLVLGNIIGRAKNQSDAESARKLQAGAQLDAQRVTQTANDFVRCLEYVAKLDETLRNGLPDSFVGYRYATGWHTWYLDEATTASICVTKGSAKAKYYLKPQNQAFALTLDDPTALAAIFAAHIASGTKMPVPS